MFFACTQWELWDCKENDLSEEEKAVLAKATPAQIREFNLSVINRHQELLQVESSNLALPLKLTPNPALNLILNTTTPNTNTNTNLNILTLTLKNANPLTLTNPNNVTLT